MNEGFSPFFSICFITLSAFFPEAIGLESFIATNLPTKQLEKYLKIAYRRFYFRPNYIIRRFKKINSHDLRASYNGLKAILKI